jgi:hypothetical protein
VFAVVSVEIARKICKWLSLAIADSYIKPEGYNNNNNFGDIFYTHHNV